MDNLRTPRRPGEGISLPVAAGAVIADGALVVAKDGYAAPGELAAGLTYIGRADQRVDNSDGAAGAKRIQVRRGGLFRWDNASGAGAITQDDVGKTAYIFDDRTVTRTAAGASPAGVILDVDPDGVWVEAGAAGSAQGTGFSLGPAQNTFDGADRATAEAARDAYAAANAGWLAIYNAAHEFFIRLNITGASAVYQRRNAAGTAWEDANFLIGVPGPAGSRPKARVTLDAAAIQGLASARRQLIAAPVAGSYIVITRITILKSGGPADAMDLVNSSTISIWLAVGPQTGGLVSSTDAADDPPDYLHFQYLYLQGFSDALGWVRPGDYLDVYAPIPGTGIGLGGFTGGGAKQVVAWTGSPLVLLGYASPGSGENPPTTDTPAQRWAAATANLADISIEIEIEYETWTP